jgi:hypothetical protein
MSVVVLEDNDDLYLPSEDGDVIPGNSQIIFDYKALDVPGIVIEVSNDRKIWIDVTSQSILVNIGIIKNLVAPYYKFWRVRNPPKWLRNSFQI